MRLPALTNHVREFFTLREAERAARAFSVDVRAPAKRAFDLAVQRREAAETLWPRGSAAEALKLATLSLEGMSAVLDALAGGLEERAPWLTTALSILAEANRRIRDVKRPELEAELQPSHDGTFQLVVDSLLAVEDLVRPEVLSIAQINRLRRQRAVLALLVAAGIVLVLALAPRAPAFSHAEASTTQGEHVASRAIDGDTKTWWVLPPGQQGWIDLTLTKPRAVHRLRIIGGNPPWHDDLTKEAHIEAFLGADVVKATDVTFRTPPTSEPDWTDVTLDAPKCDRIRISLRSEWKGAGTIGEVELH
jgi:hypothetical protein